MDIGTTTTFIVGLGVTALLWLRPPELFGPRVRIVMETLAYVAILYGPMVWLVLGGNAMNLGVPLWAALLLGTAAGAGAGWLAWTHAESSRPTSSTERPPDRAEERRVGQKGSTVGDRSADSPKERPQINIGPRSTVSIDQKGGITASTVNIITTIPQAKLTIEPRKANEPAGALYKTEFLLRIDTEIPIPNLYLQVNAPSITRMRVAPQRTGGSMSGHTGTRDGFAFTNLQTAYGSYLVTVFSKNPEQFEVVAEKR